MGVCGNVCCVAAVVKNSVFSRGVLKYVVCLCRECDGWCVDSAPPSTPAPLETV